MLTQLVVSAPKHQGFRGLPGASVSFAFHALLVYGAVVATRHADSPPPPPRATMMYLDSPDTPERPSLPRVELPDGFMLMNAPFVVPTTIPPVDLHEVWDPSWDLRTLVAAPQYTGLIPAAPSADAVLTEAATDERPELISAFAPEYPDLLRQAGIEGTVIVEVIIDTLGRAERGSLRIVRSTNPGLEPSARAAVLKAVYRPGRARGEAVRVLVQVPISYSLRR